MSYTKHWTDLGFFLDVELAVYYLKACNIVENIQGTDEWKKITLSFSK